MLENIYKRQGYLFFCHCKDNYHKTCIKSAGPVELLYKNYLCQLCAHFTFIFHSIDDTELLEIFKSKIPLNASIFNQLFTDTIEPKNNMDNFISANIQNELYVSAEEANLLMENSSNCQIQPFSSICVNVRSLLNPINYTKFEGLIASLGYKPDVVGITETWESTSSSGHFKILPGYIFVSNPRKKYKVEV